MGFGYIIHLLKHDGHYEHFVSSRTKNHIYAEDRDTDVMIANVFYEIFKSQFVCAILDDNKKRWYQFNQHRWMECDTVVAWCYTSVSTTQ